MPILIDTISPAPSIKISLQQKQGNEHHNHGHIPNNDNYVMFVGLCLEFVPSLCRTYDITIAALPLYSVIALRAQLSSAVKSNLLY